MSLIQEAHHRTDALHRTGELTPHVDTIKALIKANVYRCQLQIATSATFPNTMGDLTATSGRHGNHIQW